MSTWVDELESGAPDIVAAWRGIDVGRTAELRREVRRHSGVGTAERIVPQLATMAEALAAVVEGLSEADLDRDGGEEDWNVAQAIGHDCEARAGLSLAAARGAAVQDPSNAPEIAIVLGIPGPADADRATLLRKIAQSQRIVERSARTVAGHETEPCPLVHPLLGRLRCGEWLVFAGVHDLMHLEQLHTMMRG